MAEKLALKKALFDELKKTNEEIKKWENIDCIKENIYPSLVEANLVRLKHHKDFIQRLIDICVDRNKF